MTLADYQQELGGIVLGHGTVYPVQRLDGLGLPGRRIQDAPLSWGDGEMAGVDRSEGREITWEAGVKVPGDAGAALDALSALQDVFDAPDIRGTPNAVMPLRIKMPGRPQRTVYGRPRRFDYDDSQLIFGWVPFTATFRAMDPRFHAEEDEVLTLGLDISSTIGLVAPLVAPLTIQATTPLSRPAFLHLDGTAPSWPILRITGPCANPKVENLRTGRWLSLDVVLPANEYIEIDTRPWNRTVLRNGLSSPNARLTPGSDLDLFYVDQGTTEFRFTAVDATLTTRLSITARAAWRSL